MLLVLGLVVVVGGGRRLVHAWRARKAIQLLEDRAEPEAAAIDALVEFGRAGLMELFRLLGSAKTEALRHRAGHALSVLWARDELIAEEEKAIVSRGWAVAWRARKRYPRALRAEVPITIEFGVPFLTETGPGLRPTSLEWSFKLAGTRRASLEAFGPWTPGPVRETFRLVPGDFDTPGPHRLVLQARVRTAGLTDSWTLDLPHMPFSFEFDPSLSVPSLLALPDEGRAEEIARRVRLERPETSPGGDPRFVNLNDAFALRDPPELVVDHPLPCDLAHTLAIEFEGVPGRFQAGGIVVLGRSETSRRERVPIPMPMPSAGAVGPNAPPGPGRIQVRAVLSVDPDLGWAEPDVRSVWPGTITTDWSTVEVVRR